MATISVGSGNYMRPYRNVRLRSFKEGASQTFVVGDVLALSTTANEGDEVKVAGADPSVIVGVAAEAASGTQGTKISVWLATADAEFMAHCEDAAAIDDDDLGNGFGIVKDSTNVIWRVDRSDTTNKCVTVTELLDTHGDVNGRLVFTFQAAERVPYTDAS